MTYHKMTLESRQYHHSTQNQKLHRSVPLDFFFEKNRPSHFFILPFAKIVTPWSELNLVQFSVLMKNSSLNRGPGW